MKSPLRWTLRLGLCALASTPTTGLARWEKIDEAQAVSIASATDITVAADGTNTARYDQTTVIKLDAARSTYGTASFWYNTASSRLVAVHAETINGKKHITVTADHIEDRAERGQDQGFDKVNHVSIAFPDVTVGSQLHYTYTLQTHTVPIPGLFYSGGAFGTGTPDLPPATVTIKSKRPLELKVNDDEHYLAVDHHQAGGFDVLQVKLLRPAYFNVVNEPNGGYFDSFPAPSFEASTFKDWSEIGKSLAKPYDVELNRPVPAKFQAIADQAKAEHSSFVDRANAFTAALADLVRYQGDWRTVKGGHVPRPLATIAAAGFGDCKDMALVTAVALRRMGYKADLALIYRSEQPPNAQKVPTLSAFNHAIVHAVDEHGEVHWVDATNRVSRAQGIRADIAGRQALIVDGSRSRLENTPAFMPQDYVFRWRSERSIDQHHDEMSSHHQLHYGGGAAEALTGNELNGTKAEIDEAILRTLADGNQVLERRIAPYDLRSRVVKDLDLEVSLRSKHIPRLTTAGRAFELSSGYQALVKLDLTQRVSGVPLSHPQTFEMEQVLERSELVGHAPEPCSFQSPWLTGERRIEAAPDRIMVTERATYMAYGIPLEKLHSPEFKRLQESLKTCVGPYAVIYRLSDEAQTSPLLSH